MYFDTELSKKLLMSSSPALYHDFKTSRYYLSCFGDLIRAPLSFEVLAGVCMSSLLIRAARLVLLTGVIGGSPLHCELHQTHLLATGNLSQIRPFAKLKVVTEKALTKAFSCHF